MKNKDFIQYNEITGLEQVNVINKTKLSSQELDKLMNCDDISAGDFLWTMKI